MFLKLVFFFWNRRRPELRGRKVTASRRAGRTVVRPGGELLKSATAGDTTGRDHYGERQSVRYHRPKEREDSASTRITVKGG